jgi:aspartate carbamoyltransferase catalytic subunit
VHSLSRLLSLFDVHINYVSPDILSMPPELLTELTREGMRQRAHTTLEPILSDTDVLYVTRVQKERFEDLDDYEAVKGAYVISPETLETAKDEMIVMHPFPRVGEISMEVDDDPRAAYFQQMEYGLYVRMALLAMVLGKA